MIRMNAAMWKLLSTATSRGSLRLPQELEELLKGGLIDEQGCVYLKLLRGGVSEGTLLSLPDDTGREALVNKIHVDDYLDHDASNADLLALGVLFLGRLARLLEMQRPDDSFILILSQGLSDPSCVVRFHRERPGQGWLPLSLDDVKGEAILEVGVVDAQELWKAPKPGPRSQKPRSSDRG